MNQNLVVDARSISKSYGEVVVLDEVDLQVRTGEVFALLGPNGAGKTTMVRILATLVAPDGGTATVAGYELLGQGHQVRGAISLTGQYAAVDELLTGAENLVMMGRLRHLSRAKVRARARELLERFDLLEAGDRRVATYSGGMRRRLDLALSLVVAPTLLFLDEPTTGLDPRSREVMWTTIRDLVAAGTTVLLTTQYLQEADRLADRIAVLDHGRVIAQGSSDSLKSSIGGEVARLVLRTEEDRVRAVSLLGDRAAANAGRVTIDVATDGSATAVRLLLEDLDHAGIDVERLTLERPTLDDVFMTLTEQRPLEGAAR